MQGIAHCPSGPWKQYWPKIVCFLQYVDRNFAASRLDVDEFFGSTVDPASFLEFIDGLEQGKHGLGMSAEGSCPAVLHTLDLACSLASLTCAVIC